MKRMISSVAAGFFIFAAMASHVMGAEAGPMKQLIITDQGAIADGKTLNTEAIQKTIDAIAMAGGGTVVIPKGDFLTGAIFMKPGVNLHLDEGAVLHGTTEMKNYPERRMRIEGHFEQHYTSALINADGCDGLQISGTGVLDGNGRPIWDQFWKLRNAAKDKENFKNLSIARAQLCVINNSKNVVVQGITFKNSQFWNLHLYNCRNTRVENAHFQVPDDYKQAPSTDGIDVDSCQDIEIKGCYFSVTDDCIALKGSKGTSALQDKSSPPVERVHISDCAFKRGSAAMTLGSEATVVKDVTIENCKVTGAMSMICLKLRTDTPQDYEDIHCRNINLEGSGGSVVTIQPWKQYTDLHGEPPPKSVVRNLTISDITGSYGAFGIIQGNSGQTQISDITLTNINVKLKKPKLKAVDVTNFKIENVTVNGQPLSATPAN